MRKLFNISHGWWGASVMCVEGCHCSQFMLLLNSPLKSVYRAGAQVLFLHNIESVTFFIVVMDSWLQLKNNFFNGLPMVDLLMDAVPLEGADERERAFPFPCDPLPADETGTTRAGSSNRCSNLACSAERSVQAMTGTIMRSSGCDAVALFVGTGLPMLSLASASPGCEKPAQAASGFFLL